MPILDKNSLGGAPGDFLTSHLGTLWPFLAIAGFFVIGNSFLIVKQLEHKAQPLPETFVQENNSGDSTDFRLQPAKSAHEQYLNPFGEAWTNKTDPNPDIPVAADLCFGLDRPDYPNLSFSSEELTFLSNLNQPLLFISVCMNIEHPAYLSIYQRAIDQLKQKANKIRVLGYATISKINDWDFFYYPQVTEEWIVHKDGVTPPERVRSFVIEDWGEGWVNTHLLDVTNPQLQDFLAAQLTDAVRQTHMDGVLVDNAGFKTPPAHSQDLTSIPPSITQGWTNGEKAALTKLNQSLGSNGLVIHNGLHIDPDAQNKTNDPEIHKQLLTGSDGMYLENAGSLAQKPFTSSSWEYQSLMDILNTAQTLDKYLIFVINTVHYGTFAQSSIAVHQQAIRYNLAFYLMFFRGEKTPLLYYTPMKINDVFSTVTYFADWDLRIGPPAAPAAEVHPRVWKRQFTKAEVWWNNSDSAYQVTLPAGMLTAEGEPVSSYTLPARSGMIFVTTQVLEPYNPSFETVWLWKPNQTGYWGDMDYSVKHDGKRSLKIKGAVDVPRGVQQTFEFKPNTRYQYSSWIKAENNHGATAYVVSAPPGTTAQDGGTAYDTQDWTFLSLALPQGSFDWQKQTLVFTTGSQGGTGYVNAVVQSSTSDTTVWFDETKVELGSETPPSSTAPSASPSPSPQTVVTSSSSDSSSEASSPDVSEGTSDSSPSPSPQTVTPGVKQTPSPLPATSPVSDSGFAALLGRPSASPKGAIQQQLAFEESSPSPIAPIAPIPALPSACLGDYNYDGAIDLQDILFVMRNIGRPAPDGGVFGLGKLLTILKGLDRC
jgi:hypothetical protein